MKILIDGQTLLTPEADRGIGTYFKSVVQSLLENDFTNDYYINLSDEKALRGLSSWARERINPVVSAAFRPRAHDEATRHSSEAYSDALGNEMERRRIDLYWSLNPLMGSVHLPAKTIQRRYAATIYDLIPVVFRNIYLNRWAADDKRLYETKLRSLGDYDMFLHISRHTQSDFMRHVETAGKRHVLALAAASDCFVPDPFPEVIRKNRYALYVGGFDPRKNMTGALAAYAELQRSYSHDERIRSVDLLIVCQLDETAKEELMRQARDFGVESRVGFTGFVGGDDLRRIYQKACCLFFPSLYEGFGLPVLEALACGIPVAASNTSSLPEVGGEFATYFDPHDTDDMASALRKVLHEPTDYATRMNRHAYSKKFSWQQTAVEVLRAFELCAPPRPAPLPAAQSIAPEIVQPDCAEEANSMEATFVDVRRLMKELTVEELCETAEEFFARLGNHDYLLSKPFAAIAEVPDLLYGFAQVVQGLKLLPDMTILDFGVGSGWTSRFLSQMGLNVIASDVSQSALDIARKLYGRHPVIGDQPAPRFLPFNGHRFDLPDNSVDRISCWDAFHHVPNPAKVLGEMARVLTDGGIAGFSEPGPNHSKTPQSQYEMRTHRVIENDVNMREIWEAAQGAGFTDIKLALFNPAAFMLPLEEFEAFVEGTSDGQSYANETRAQMQHRRVFFLYKGRANSLLDSRERSCLAAHLDVTLEASRVPAGKPFRLTAVVKNTGSGRWLPTTARVGAVRFGAHLFDDNGILLDLDYHRHALTPGDGRIIEIGETLNFTAEVPSPPAGGKFIFEFDLVSEAVCWFEHNGSRTVRLAVEVI